MYLLCSIFPPVLIEALCIVNAQNFPKSYSQMMVLIEALCIVNWNERHWLKKRFFVLIEALCIVNFL